jgi:hypothetical protein
MAVVPAKPSIADTFTRLLRLNAGSGPARVTRAQLIVASEQELARIAASGPIRERAIARTLRATPADYLKWEAEHGRLMSAVAGEANGERQARALLSAALSLVHRKALFEHLHSHARRGEDRRFLIAHFLGQKSYSQAVVAEHGNYQRSVASLACIEQIGTTLLPHQAFGELLRRYENLYTEYFRSYCNSLLTPANEAAEMSDSMRTLIPYLKRDVLDERARLLALPAMAGAQSAR